MKKNNMMGMLAGVVLVLSPTTGQTAIYTNRFVISPNPESLAVNFTNAGNSFVGNGSGLNNVSANVATNDSLGKPIVNITSWTNITLVDAVNGNDSTAIRGNPNLPFQSISNAQASATGGIMWVKAGNYTTPIQTYTSQTITNFNPIWYLDPNATVYVDGGAHIGSATQPLMILGHGNVNINFDCAFGTNTVYIECANFDTNSPLAGAGTENDVGLNGTNLVIIKCDKTAVLSSIGASSLTVPNGNLLVYAPLIKLNELITSPSIAPSQTWRLNAETIEFRDNDNGYILGTNSEFNSTIGIEKTDTGNIGVGFLTNVIWNVRRTLSWGADGGQFQNVKFVGNPTFVGAISTLGTSGAYTTNGVLIANGTFSGNGAGLTNLPISGNVYSNTIVSFNSLSASNRNNNNLFLGPVTSSNQFNGTLIGNATGLANTNTLNVTFYSPTPVQETFTNLGNGVYWFTNPAVANSSQAISNNGVSWVYFLNTFGKVSTNSSGNLLGYYDGAFYQINVTSFGGLTNYTGAFAGDGSELTGVQAQSLNPLGTTIGQWFIYTNALGTLETSNTITGVRFLIRTNGQFIIPNQTAAGFVAFGDATNNGIKFFGNGDVTLVNLGTSVAGVTNGGFWATNLTALGSAVNGAGGNLALLGANQTFSGINNFTGITNTGAFTNVGTIGVGGAAVLGSTLNVLGAITSSGIVTGTSFRGASVQNGSTGQNPFTIGTATTPTVNLLGTNFLVGPATTFSNSLTAVSISTTVSNTLPSFTITMPASGVNWTNNQGYNIFVFIDNTGVTGTAISRNGSQVFTSVTGDATIPLHAGEYFSETYTIGTPTAKGAPY